MVGAADPSECTVVLGVDGDPSEPTWPLLARVGPGVGPAKAEPALLGAELPEAALFAPEPACGPGTADPPAPLDPARSLPGVAAGMAASPAAAALDSSEEEEDDDELDELELDELDELDAAADDDVVRAVPSRKPTPTTAAATTPPATTRLITVVRRFAPSRCSAWA